MRQALNKGCISPASRNREILEKSTFLQDFWIPAAGGVIHLEQVTTNYSFFDEHG